MASLPEHPAVVIVGAGAMGCLFAARLTEQGARVTVVDVDGERLDTIGREGITLKDDNGERVLPVAASLSADVTAPVDLLMLFTKGVHSEAAIASVAHLAQAAPLALTLQNGIGNAELLARQFGEERVLMGTAHVPSDLIGPAAIETHGFGSVELGGISPAAHQHAQALADLLTAAGFGTKVAQDVNAAVWEKVAFNAALNATAMICEVPNAGMNNDPGKRIAAQVVEETVQVAKASGITLDGGTILATIEAALSQHAHHKASMLQDREAGRRTEIETINGAVAREGKRMGVPTPVCDTLCDLVRVIELKAEQR